MNEDSSFTIVKKIMHICAMVIDSMYDSKDLENMMKDYFCGNICNKDNCDINCIVSQTIIALAEYRGYADQLYSVLQTMLNNTKIERG